MSDWKPATGQRIERLFAWVSIDPDGGEGVMAVNMMIAGRPTLVPLVGADMDRVESYREIAEMVARKTGLPARLIEFGSRQEVSDGVAHAV